MGNLLGVNQKKRIVYRVPPIDHFLFKS